MLAELKGQFLPQFIADTGARLRSALSLMPPVGPGGEATAHSIAEMMHTIAGEAMLIGAPELVLLARAAGGAARRYLETRNDVALVACARALRSLARAVDELASASAAAPAANSPASRPQPQRQIRVMVIDDSPLNASLLCEGLERAGFDSKAAPDELEQALTQIAQYRPHIVLVDFLMPRCSPRELCRRIHGTPALANTRIILVTSLSEKEAAERAQAVGAVASVSKELGIPAIIDRVRSLAAAVT